MSALRRRPGLRFLVEAVLIVLTAVITGALHLGPWGIGGAVAIVWLTYVVIEYSLAHPREEKARPEPTVEPAPEPEQELVAPRSDSVRVIARPPDPEPVAAEPEPEPEPEPELEEVSDTETVSDTGVEPEPELEEVSDTGAAPDADEPVEGPREPQHWNVWEIERALRASGESTEEREFLLIYLRDYAGPDGLLPLDFDELVRESFPDVVGTPTG